MKLLPLGTIIKIDKYKLCIIGYTPVEKDDIMLGGYFVVLYPLGFTSVEKVYFIPHNYDFEIVSEGYITKSYKAFLDTLCDGFELVENVSNEELLKLNQELKKVSISKRRNQV